MLLDALVERGSPALAATAARDKAFSAYCRDRAESRLLHAKKALMAYHWWIAGKVPKDNDAFSREISIQSWQEDDGKRMTGVQIGSQYVDGNDMEAYALRQVSQALLMRSAAKGQPPPADLKSQAAAELTRLLTDLQTRY